MKSGKTKCPVCSCIVPPPFLSLKRVPVHQNMVCRTQEEASTIVRGNLSLCCCSRCGFVFNRDFDQTLIAYGGRYDNTQISSNAFKDYMTGLVRYLAEVKGVQKSTIVEVGCGKGSFIKQLIENPSWKNRGYGFDTSYTGRRAFYNGRLIFKNKYYDEKSIKIKADVVICRHVIEHVQDPCSLLKMIYNALELSKKPRVYIETPCVEWIFKNGVLWDFFYEHCSYFTKKSLAKAAHSAGFQVTGIRHVFGGQYLWAELTPQTFHRTMNTASPNISRLAKMYTHGFSEKKESWITLVDRTRQCGNVAVWGAGAKGVTFVNLVDPKKKRINCVIDLNRNKVGGFIPGTGHPIVGVKEAWARGIRSAILMNPNYETENLSLMDAKHIAINLITDIHN
jgi:hypothetical protein